MSQIPWMRIRSLCVQQGDIPARLREIIRIATELLAEYPDEKKARKKTGGKDRLERGGRDRKE